MGKHREKTDINKLKREDSGETNPAGALILDFQPPELTDNKFLSFKSVSLWIFVTEAQVD
jgi:hypothetical protein